MLPWNRKEIYTTLSFNDFAKAKEMLQINRINYDYKVVDQSGANMFESRRRQFGSLGLNADVIKQYYLYVHKNDYEKAGYLLRL